jgi:hypothetical protein
MRRNYTDVEFEVVSDPRAKRIVPFRRTRRPVSALSVIRWSYVGLLVGLALLTGLVGLSGADIDTRTPRQPPPVLSPDQLPIPPVR